MRYAYPPYKKYALFADFLSICNCATPNTSPLPFQKLTMSEPVKPHTPALITNNACSRNPLPTLVLMAVTVTGIYLCYLLSAPFLPVIAWALAFAVLCAPLHRRLLAKIKRPNLAATLTVLVVALTVVVPLSFIAERVIGEAASGAETVKTLVETGTWRRAFEAHPGLAPVGHWLERQFDLPGLVKSAAAWLTSLATTFVKGSVLQLIGMVLSFYTLYYFLRDRETLLASLRALSPLSAADMDRLFGEVGDTIYATFYGTLIVSVVQGALGGLMFWWLDLPAPLLWGLVMALLAVVPVLGAFVIWVPAAFFLLLEGSGDKALLLALWGTVVVGGIDNLLYPMLVGERMKMHTLLAFMAIVGGLIVFGAAGLILGPVVFTVTRFLLEIWHRRNAEANAHSP